MRLHCYNTHDTSSRARDAPFTERACRSLTPHPSLSRRSERVKRATRLGLRRCIGDRREWCRAGIRRGIVCRAHLHMGSIHIPIIPVIRCVVAIVTVGSNRECTVTVGGSRPKQHTTTAGACPIVVVVVVPLVGPEGAGAGSRDELDVASPFLAERTRERRLAGLETARDAGSDDNGYQQQDTHCRARLAQFFPPAARWLGCGRDDVGAPVELQANLVRARCSGRPRRRGCKGRLQGIGNTIIHATHAQVGERRGGSANLAQAFSPCHRAA